MLLAKDAGNQDRERIKAQVDSSSVKGGFWHLLLIKAPDKGRTKEMQLREAFACQPRVLPVLLRRPPCVTHRSISSVMLVG